MPSHSLTPGTTEGFPLTNPKEVFMIGSSGSPLSEVAVTFSEEGAVVERAALSNSEKLKRAYNTTTLQCMLAGGLPIKIVVCSSIEWKKRPN